MTIIERIQALAKEQGVNQKTIAEACGEKYSTDDKDTDTQRLLDIFSGLDWEGKQVVTATAIAENRRIEASLTRARA